MAGSRNPTWNRDELTIALNAYFRSLETGHVEDRDVIREILPIINLVAEKPVRNIRSVANKIENFRFLDGKTTSSRSNYGKGDRKVYEEYVKDHVPSPRLREECDRIRRECLTAVVEIAETLEGEMLLDSNGNPLPETIETPLESWEWQKIRLAQDEFRESVLGEYGRRCCITGMSGDGLLVASHIKPWCEARGEEKVDPRNGLCLNGTFDKLFDRGFMGLEDGGSDRYVIKFSDNVDDLVGDECYRKYLEPHSGEPLISPKRVPGPDSKYVEYHDEKIFKRKIKKSDLPARTGRIVFSMSVGRIPPHLDFQDFRNR